MSPRFTRQYQAHFLYAIGSDSLELAQCLARKHVAVQTDDPQKRSHEESTHKVATQLTIYGTRIIVRLPKKRVSHLLGWLHRGSAGPPERIGRNCGGEFQS